MPINFKAIHICKKERLIYVQVFTVTLRPCLSNHLKPLKLVTVVFFLHNENIHTCRNINFEKTGMKGKKDIYGHQYSRRYMRFLINNLLMSIRANKFQGDTYL